MMTWRALTSLWDWEPTVLLGCAALLLGYVALTRRQPSRHAFWFVAGVLLIVVALCSPLDTLGDTYLFSAHMLQHMLLVLVVPPLLILGIPAWQVERWLRNPTVATVECIVRRPAVAWLLGIGTVYLWHAPPLYNATLAHTVIHIAEHLSFLVTGTVFWWPVCAPRAASRLPHLVAAFYLFIAAVASSSLGIILTFAAPGLYPAYLHPADPRGVLTLVRNGWGLSAATDQQLGGLCMWVLGGLIYLCAILATFAHWYAEDEVLTPSPSPSPLQPDGLNALLAMERVDSAGSSVPVGQALIIPKFSPSPSLYEPWSIPGVGAMERGTGGEDQP